MTELDGRPRHRQGARFSLAVAGFGLLVAGTALAQQITGADDVDVSKRPGDEAECTISQHPKNPDLLFVACNFLGQGLFSARSSNGGKDWETRTIGEDGGPLPRACCDPSSAWDSFGNLYLAYIDDPKNEVVILVDRDDKKGFTVLDHFEGTDVDQPTITAADTPDSKFPAAVWVVWNQGEPSPGSATSFMYARGARVTGPGAIGRFQGLQTIPETSGCSFGDVAIAPNGAVFQTCQKPTAGQEPGTIIVNVDPDGFGPENFGSPLLVRTTNVGGHDFIPAQMEATVDAEAGLAFDRNRKSPHFGWLYLVYTDEVVDEQNDLDVMLLYSKDRGAHWIGPIRVNDDPSGASQFLPRIALDDSTGNISVCWYDCRNSPPTLSQGGTPVPNNTTMQVYCAVAPATGSDLHFLPSVLISDAGPTAPGSGYQAGDYMGFAYRNGVAHPIWVDTAAAAQQGGTQQGGTLTYDAITDRVAKKEIVNSLQQTAPAKQARKSRQRRKEVTH